MPLPGRLSFAFESCRDPAATKIAKLAKPLQRPLVQVKRRKRQRVLERKAGPVTVRVLDSDLSGQPSGGGASLSILHVSISFDSTVLLSGLLLGFPLHA